MPKYTKCPLPFREIGTTVTALVGLCTLCAAAPPQAIDTGGLLQHGQFLHIPGPNPILTPGNEGTWDDVIVEAADAFNDFGTYYLYYHGNGGNGYRIGVATAKHPLGPFRRHGDKPVLDLGPKGSWDDTHVACAMILKEGLGKYRMWYSGYGQGESEKWGIGLASATSPAGPWTKHPGNPVIDHFGYVGGVVKRDGRYWLYTAHPIGSTGPDYSPMALATAEKPEGPWTKHPGNPVLRQGEWGEWDDGGFSEAEVVHHGGMFHMFYGGAKLYRPRILTRESIGYAYSTDGVHFTKYGRNPVAARMAEPNAAAYAEVHAIIEPPFVYLYHTLRYQEPWRKRFTQQFPNVEDLGVQVLVMQRPFRLDMPVLNLATLPANTTTSLSSEVCRPISLCQVERVALTFECMFSRKASGGLVVAVYSSPDGITYDTDPLNVSSYLPRPGRTLRVTREVEIGARFIKVQVNNRDKIEPIQNVKVTATLGG